MFANKIVWSQSKNLFNILFPFAIKLIEKIFILKKKQRPIQEVAFIYFEIPNIILIII